MKRIFLTIAFAISSVAGYAQTSSDTTFKDITGEYRLKIPALSEDIRDFQVAIISLDSIGKKSIKWNYNRGGILTPDDEIEFENELLKCMQGKDTVGEMTEKTIKRKNYCLRKGYEDHAMGKTYEVNYISFKKSNELVIIEFAVIWRNCHHGYDGEQIKDCEKEEASKRDRIDAFIDEVVNKISFYKVTNK